jgi:hypothetical protein
MTLNTVFSILPRNSHDYCNYRNDTIKHTSMHIVLILIKSDQQRCMKNIMLTGIYDRNQFSFPRKYYQENCPKRTSQINPKCLNKLAHLNSSSSLEGHLLLQYFNHYVLN